MKGSKVQNIKFDNKKQKIVLCEGCSKEIIIGKFAKNNQRCNDCKNSSKKKSKKQKANATTEKQQLFSAKLQDLCTRLGFSITDKRSWKKRYGIDGGGVATIHIMPEQGITGVDPRIEYFSLVIQRAVGINENFRQFMPPDAASDCEVIAGELGGITNHSASIGKERCDSCGAETYEFGVDSKAGKILCITPNNCFKKKINMAGAEAVAD